jgi:hypothetical protein
MTNINKQPREFLDLKMKISLGKCKLVGVKHIYPLDERKTNLMQLLYIFIVVVGDALHVSGVFAHR